MPQTDPDKRKIYNKEYYAKKKLYAQKYREEHKEEIKAKNAIINAQKKEEYLKQISDPEFIKQQKNQKDEMLRNTKYIHHVNKNGNDCIHCVYDFDQL